MDEDDSNQEKIEAVIEEMGATTADDRIEIADAEKALIVADGLGNVNNPYSHDSSPFSSYCSAIDDMLISSVKSTSAERKGRPLLQEQDVLIYNSNPEDDQQGECFQPKNCPFTPAPQVFDEMLQTNVVRSYGIWILIFPCYYLILDREDLSKLILPTLWQQFVDQGNSVYILGDGSQLNTFVTRVDVPIAWEFYGVNGNFLELLFSECSSATCLPREFFAAVHSLSQVNFNILHTASYFYCKYDWGLQDYFTTARQCMIVELLGVAIMPCGNILLYNCSWFTNFSFAGCVILGKSEKMQALWGFSLGNLWKTIRGVCLTVFSPTAVGVQRYLIRLLLVLNTLDTRQLSKSNEGTQARPDGVGTCGCSNYMILYFKLLPLQENFSWLYSEFDSKNYSTAATLSEFHGVVFKIVMPNRLHFARQSLMGLYFLIGLFYIISAVHDVRQAMRTRKKVLLFSLQLLLEEIWWADFLYSATKFEGASDLLIEGCIVIVSHMHKSIAKNSFNIIWLTTTPMNGNIRSPLVFYNLFTASHCCVQLCHANYIQVTHNTILVKLLLAKMRQTQKYTRKDSKISSISFIHTFDISLLTTKEGMFTVRASARDTHLGGAIFLNSLARVVIPLNPQKLWKFSIDGGTLKKLSSDSLIDVVTADEGCIFQNSYTGKKATLLVGNVWPLHVLLVGAVMSTGDNQFGGQAVLTRAPGVYSNNYTHQPANRTKHKAYLNGSMLCALMVFKGGTQISTILELICQGSAQLVVVQVDTREEAGPEYRYVYILKDLSNTFTMGSCNIPIVAANS